jgi:hypothetical protein
MIVEYKSEKGKTYMSQRFGEAIQATTQHWIGEQRLPCQQLLPFFLKRSSPLRPAGIRLIHIAVMTISRDTGTAFSTFETSLLPFEDGKNQ